MKLERSSKGEWWRTGAEETGDGAAEREQGAQPRRHSDVHHCYLPHPAQSQVHEKHKVHQRCFKNYLDPLLVIIYYTDIYSSSGSVRNSSN